MKTQPSWIRPLALGASFGIALVPLAGAAGVAEASTLSCGLQVSGATEVAPGVCEVSYLTHGTYSFTAPSGISKLSAVVVGAGAAGIQPYWDNVYGGGGGSVVFVDSVDITAPTAITVGMGGFAGSAGEASLVNSTSAAGGGAPTDLASGASENFAGVVGLWAGASGSGLGAAGTSAGDTNDSTPRSFVGGAGVTIASVSGSSTLFGLPGDTAEYGGGGAISVYGYTPVATGTTPGSGGAANGGTTDIALDGSALDGADGAVYLRWAEDVAPTPEATPAAELSHTGFADNGFLAGGVAALALGALGVTAAAVTRRVQSRNL